MFMKLKAFYGGGISAPQIMVSSLETTQRHARPSSANEGFHTVKCYPCVIETEPPYQSIMNATDNNVTKYIIQMILSSQSCV